MPFIGNKPSAVPLTSADIADSIITSAKIVDATIANADIANSTINLTTKVTGTLPVANGGTGLAALGTANQVLATNSGATALEFQSVSSDYVLLATATASASASISFDGYFSNTYDSYIMKIYDVQASAVQRLTIQLGYGSTPTYITSNYKDMTHGSYTSFSTIDATWCDFTTGGSNGWEIRFDQGNFADQTSYYDLNLVNMRSTSTSYKGFLCHSLARGTGHEMRIMHSTGWCYDSTITANAVTGIKFGFTGGATITKGKFVLYGLKGI